MCVFFFFQAEDGIRDAQESRGLGDVYKRQVLQVLIFAVGISFFNSLLTNSVVIFGKQNRLLKPYFIATVFNLAANILLIPIYSYLAAAVTTVVTELSLIHI